MLGSVGPFGMKALSRCEIHVGSISKPSIIVSQQALEDGGRRKS